MLLSFQSSKVSFIMKLSIFSESKIFLLILLIAVSHAKKCPARIKGSKLVVGRLTNHRRNGGWCKDPLELSNIVYLMNWSRYDEGVLYEFNSYQDMISGRSKGFHRTPDYIDGTGFTVYGGFIYYNKAGTRMMVKYNLIETQTPLIKVLPEANYNGVSPYATDLYSDINFAVDESGLWAIYATERNFGNIVVSRINPNTLKVEGTWQTSYEKISALNAFITCAVLYVINYDNLEIDYIYNMTSSSGKFVHIPVPGLNKTTSSIKYNPADKSLYIWDNKILSNYTVSLEPVVSTVSTTSTTTTIATSSSTTTITASPTPSPSSTTAQIPSVPNPVSPPIKPTPSDPKVFCSGRKIGEFLWPDTLITNVATINCTENSKDTAFWHCGGSANNPQWIPSEPDFSSCKSLWVQNLKNEIEKGKSSLDISLYLSEKLMDITTQIKPWDIVEIVKILNYTLDETSFEFNSALLLTDHVLKSTNALLKQDRMNHWKNLYKNIKTSTALDLTTVMQRSAFILAESFILNSSDNQHKAGTCQQTSTNRIDCKQPYTALSILVEPVYKDAADTSSDSVRLQISNGDAMKIRIKSLVKSLDAQSGEILALVYLSFSSLGFYMVDDKNFGSGSYPSDSGLATVAVKRMLNNGSWSKQKKIKNLETPLTLDFQHIQSYYSKHVCAYWNEDKGTTDGGYWWRSGCKIVKGNSSFSRCECDHLTNFIILSSNKNFPLMGIATPGVGNTPLSSSLFVYINVVRTVGTLSIILLLGVLIFLVRWRRRTDLQIIHINLVISTTISLLVLVIGIDQVSASTFCAVVAGILHYTILCSFIWCAVETMHILLGFKDLHESHDRWKWYILIAYLTPLLVVGMSAAIDYSGYLGQPACWLRTNGNSMWFIVIPCSVAIIIGVLCTSVLVCKLNKRYTATPRDPKRIKRARCDAAKSCLLLVLICIMWSSIFIWISGIVEMACVFAVVCFLYGAASLVVHCFCTPRIRLSRDWPRFNFIVKKNHRSQSSSTTTHNIRRGDGSSLSYDYRYSVSRERNPASLVPTTRSSHLLNFTGDEDTAPLVIQHPSMSRDRLTKLRNLNSNVGNTFNSLDESNDPSYRASQIASGIQNSRLDGPHPNMQPSRAASINPGCYHRSSTNTCLHLHQYEQPAGAPDRHCSDMECTSLSYCYDHLHVDPSKRNTSSSQIRRSCGRCPSNRFNHEYQNTSRHHYETLESFQEQGVVSEALSIEVNYPPGQHRCDAVDADDTNLKQIRTCHATCHHRLLNHSKYPDIPETASTPAGRWQNNSYGFCPHSHVIGSKIPPHFSGHAPRNGRCSDPLSVDLGYDTDSQHPGACQACHSNSDGDQRTPGSTPGLLDQEQAQQSTNLQRQNSMSGSSENDREVEFINSPLTSNPDSPNSAKLVPETHSISVRESNYAHSNSNGIITSIGGRNSVSDTVTSWTAIPGSNPRSSFPEYGQNKTSRKTTSDPQEILEQARQNCDLRRNVDVSGKDDKLSPNSYTLPGTSDADTKARIDLRSGGVSMVSNI